MEQGIYNGISIDVDERGQRGIENFMKGYNCAQSVVMAFADVFGLTDELALRVAASFGAGGGRLRLTCGCVSGMFILAGLENGPTVAGDIDARTRNYALVQELAACFKAENDSLICSELLGLRTGKIESPRPSERNAEYYKSRPCSRLTESACRIFARHLIGLGEKIEN